MPTDDAAPPNGAEPPVFTPSPLDEWPGEDEEELLQLVEFGRRIKRTPRQVHNLCDAGCPTRMRGDQRFVPWPRGLHWVIERRVADQVQRELAKRRAAPGLPGGVAGGTAPPGLDAHAVLEAQAREQIAKADERQAIAERKILAVQKERGEVMLVDDAVRLLEDKLRPLRAVLQNFPSRWATELLGITSVREMRAKLDAGVREAMRLLAGTADPGAIEAAPTAAPAPDPAPAPEVAAGVAPGAPSARSRAGKVAGKAPGNGPGKAARTTRAKAAPAPAAKPPARRGRG